MGIFDKITTNLRDMFKANTNQAGYKMDISDSTFESKKQRDAVLNQRQMNISDAQSWNPETHPEGIGSSYLVNNIDYNPETEDLEVQYRDGFKARYGDISLSQAKDFISADSKGRWALKHLWPLSYEQA